MLVMRATVSLLVVAALALPTTPAARVQDDTMGERITTTAFDGVVVYPAGRNESKYWWIPTRRDVMAAEAALTAAVSRSALAKTRVGRELHHYKRQYRPIRNGGRQIVIIGFHESQVDDGRWLRQPLIAMGGGDNFFDATYSFKTGTIVSLNVNAPK